MRFQTVPGGRASVAETRPTPVDLAQVLGSVGAGVEDALAPLARFYEQQFLMIPICIGPNIPTWIKLHHLPYPSLDHERLLKERSHMQPSIEDFITLHLRTRGAPHDLRITLPTRKMLKH